MVKSIFKKGARRSSENDVNHNASAEIGRCIVVSPTHPRNLGRQQKASEKAFASSLVYAAKPALTQRRLKIRLCYLRFNYSLSYNV
jgi:hypothetical protein